MVAALLSLAVTACAEVVDPGAPFHCSELSPPAARPDPPRAYASDGCSAGLSTMSRALTGRPPSFEDLCLSHDRRYWCGGSAAERQQADEALRAGMAARGRPVLGALMYGMVRMGGHPLWPASWRWGYGWPWRRGYGEQAHP